MGVGRGSVRASGLLRVWRLLWGTVGLGLLGEGCRCGEVASAAELEVYLAVGFGVAVVEHVFGGGEVCLAGVEGDFGDGVVGEGGEEGLAEGVVGVFGAGEEIVGVEGLGHRCEGGVDAE